MAQEWRGEGNKGISSSEKEFLYKRIIGGHLYEE
jgi:hypothetical protein